MFCISLNSCSPGVSCRASGLAPSGGCKSHFTVLKVWLPQLTLKVVLLLTQCGFDGDFTLSCRAQATFEDTRHWEAVTCRGPRCLTGVLMPFSNNHLYQLMIATM